MFFLLLQRKMAKYSVYYGREPLEGSPKQEKVFWVLHGDNQKDQKFNSIDDLILFAKKKRIKPNPKPERLPVSDNGYKIDMMYESDIHRFYEVWKMSAREIEEMKKEREKIAEKARDPRFMKKLRKRVMDSEERALNDFFANYG